MRNRITHPLTNTVFNQNFLAFQGVPNPNSPSFSPFTLKHNFLIGGNSNSNWTFIVLNLTFMKGGSKVQQDQDGSKIANNASLRVGNILVVVFTSKSLRLEVFHTRLFL